MTDKTADQIDLTTSGSGRIYRRKSAVERRALRRSRLLEAAVEAFGTQGYRATPIEQLCTAAGISTRNFYEEFPSREALAIELHDDLNRRALEAVELAIGGCDPSDLEARARAGMAAYLRVMTEDRRWARIALVETVGVSPTAEQHRRRAIEGFAAVLLAEANRLAAAGIVPARDFSLTAVALVGAVNGLVNTWTAAADWHAQVNEVAEEATRLILLAIRGA